MVSRSLRHSLASSFFSAIASICAARMWKETFVAQGTLAPQASTVLKNILPRGVHSEINLVAMVGRWGGGVASGCMMFFSLIKVLCLHLVEM